MWPVEEHLPILNETQGSTPSPENVKENNNLACVRDAQVLENCAVLPALYCYSVPIADRL